MTREMEHSLQTQAYELQEDLRRTEAQLQANLMARRELRLHAKRQLAETLVEMQELGCWPITPNEWRETPVVSGVQMRLCSLDFYTENHTVANLLIGANGNGEIAPHKHAQQEIIHVISGSYVDPVTGRHYKEGDTQIIPPGTMHGLTSEFALLTVVWRPAFEQTDSIKDPLCVI